MTAMLRVDLRETEHLAVGQRTVELCAQRLQVIHLFRIERQAFLLVVCLDVGDVNNLIRFFENFKDVGAEILIKALKHLVVGWIFCCCREKLFNAFNSGKTHVLGYFHRVRTPRGYHLPARSHKLAFHRRGVKQLGVVEQPF